MDDAETPGTLETSGTNWRDTAAAEFRALLENVPDDKYCAGGPGAGEDNGERVDLFTLLSEMTALKTEVSLQSRNSQAIVSETRDAVRSFREELALHASALEETRGILKSRAPAERREAARNALLEITALRESVLNALESSKALRDSSRSWFAKQNKIRDTFVAVMERLMAVADMALARLRLEPAAKKGMPFNPEFMRAVAVTDKGDAEENTVFAVVRQGYTHEAALLLAAEVEVKKSNP
jgi:molecular chaperone GrpE